MNRQTALTRLTDVAVNDVFPLARQVIARTRRVVDDLALRTFGPDFEERCARVRDRYERMGGDRSASFGLQNTSMMARSFTASASHDRPWIHNVPRVGPSSSRITRGSAVRRRGHGMGTLIAEPPRMIRAMVDKWVQLCVRVGAVRRRGGRRPRTASGCSNKRSSFWRSPKGRAASPSRSLGGIS